MRYTERKQWLYDPKMGALANTVTALRIHAEYIRMHGAKPPPTFFEADRRPDKVDSLWHIPTDERTSFSRQLVIPAIVLKDKPDWRLTKIGLVAQQKHKFWLSNLDLSQQDWFPTRGDMVFYDGYRHMIIRAAPEPSSFWGQTNVWLGIVAETIIPAVGDARPLVDQSVAAPSELIQTEPVPEL